MLGQRYQFDGKSIIPLKPKQKQARHEIVERLSNGDYTFVSRDCVCGSAEFDAISEKDAYGLPCKVVICKQCGLIQVSPCPNERTLDHFYSNY